MELENSFVEDTSKKTGLGKSAINQEIQIARDLELEVKEFIKEREKGKEKQLATLPKKSEKGFQKINAYCSEQQTLEEEPHVSLKKVAKQLGISDKTLWQWEKITEKAIRERATTNVSTYYN